MPRPDARALLASWKPVHPHDEVWDHFDHSKAEPIPPNRPLNGMFDFDRFDEGSPWKQLFDWGILPKDCAAETPDALTVSTAERFLAAPPADKPFIFAAGH